MHHMYKYFVWIMDTLHVMPRHAMPRHAVPRLSVRRRQRTTWRMRAVLTLTASAPSPFLSLSLSLSPHLSLSLPCVISLFDIAWAILISNSCRFSPPSASTSSFLRFSSSPKLTVKRNSRLSFEFRINRYIRSSQIRIAHVYCVDIAAAE